MEMKVTKKQFGKKTGFTIIELLTVMSIIVILISVLVPGLNMARRYAKHVKQKAQFHSIGVALEQFSADQGGYPESGLTAAAPYTVGAQRLAEALMGRDRRGYDPMSNWDAQADSGSTTIYANDPLTPEGLASLDRRKGPYLPDVAAFQVVELYPLPASTGSVYPGITTPAPVLTDEYTVKNVTTASGKAVKAGSPVLYYKANVSSTLFPDSNSAINPVTNSYIINCLDNEELIALGTVKSGGSVKHFFDFISSPVTAVTARQMFYQAITNPQMSPPWPYNQDSYILISAGFDGVFGTKDDVFNFGE
jgi:prepilin-type N-terminal cleavage/methylation domain-containing protein